MKSLGKLLVLFLLAFALGSLGSNWLGKGVAKVEQYFKPERFENPSNYTATTTSTPLSLEKKSSEGSQIKLRLVGDIMLDRGVKQMVILHQAGDYSFVFKEIPGLKENVDILFGNLEGPVSVRGTNRGSIYSFRMDPAAVPALKKAGFDVVSVANNHAGDWDSQAFLDTLGYLKKAGILYTGGGRNLAEAATTSVLLVKNLRVGFLGFSDVGPQWLSAGPNTAGILIADERIKSRVEKAAKEVDFLVVSFHFGEEYMDRSNPRQQNLAKLAVDSGADLVVGHHPHVVQETEDYNGGFIAYSLGNFIFDQYFSPDTMEGMVLDVELGQDGKIKEVKKNLVKLNKFFQPAFAR